MKTRLIDVVKTTKEPFVVILIGPPLSGKSTQLELAKGSGIDFDIIGADAILMEKYASNGETYTEAYAKSNSKDVNRILKERLEEASDLGRNVIVDMTNLTSKRRRTTLNYFGDEYVKIAYQFELLDKVEYLKRNAKRNEEIGKYIPESVIFSMIASFQTPSKEEGFNKIFYS